MASETPAAASKTAPRQRRFSKALLNDAGESLDADEIEAVTGLAIYVDGKPVNFSLDSLTEPVLKRLLFDGLYDRLTRAVHSAKPVADTRDAAVEVIYAAFEKLKVGDFKRHRKPSDGSGAPRAFDPSRFKSAIYAAAKALGKEISEEKYARLIAQLGSMSGKDRQKFIATNFLRDPHFKLAWDKPVFDKKKAALKRGELASSVADLAA